MKRFLKALLPPFLIVLALNWRTTYTVVRFTLFPPKIQPVTAAHAPVTSETQADNSLVIEALDLTAPVIPSPADPTQASDWGILKQNLTQGVGLAEKLPKPGEKGTTIIIGHSSDWTPHKYSAVFASLDQLPVGAEIRLKYHGQLYRYTVREKQVVDPMNLTFFTKELEGVTDKNQLALVTCWPIFTTAKRLVVVAEPAV